MDEEIVDRVTGWEPVTGPAAADLRSLARDEFSGAVTAGAAWAFLLNGRVVGLFDGDLDDFEAGDLTAYSAPDPALPLLFAMRETGGETRGKYYSEETSLREVDRTLSSGKFTGYVELSENVLSGDYYVVYHGGRSMSVAFVGASERLVTGDEAFDRADDEVGIFAVNAVDVTVTDLPESADGDAPAGVVGGSEDDGSDEDDVSTDDGPRQEGVTFGASDTRETDSAAEEDGAAEETADSDAAPAASARETDRYDGLTGDMGIGLNSDDSSEPDAAEEPPSDDDASEPAAVSDHTAESATGLDATESPADDLSGSHAADEPETDAGFEDRGADDEPASADDGDAESTRRPAPADDASSGDDDSEPDGPADPREPSDESADADDAVAATNGEATDERTEATGEPGGAEDVETAATAERSARDDERTESESQASVGRDESGVFSAERQWQQTKRIPALSPDDSLVRQEEATTGAEGDADEPHAADEAHDVAQSAGSDSRVASAADGSESATAPADDAGETDRLTARLEQVRAERDELAAAVESLEDDLESVTRERDRLRARVADLESELATLREEADRAVAGDTEGTGGQRETERLSPAAAREGTNLFVRYRSKGKPTLKKAQAGEAKQGEVVENLRLEYHTTFDSEHATVDGESYESFLHGTTEWGFTKWVVEDLLYEIGRSGHRVDLAPLFDRIPEIDRVEFDGTVPVTVEDDEGSQSHESRTFDLVFWNSMGDPLFVVDVDTSRNATTQGMVGSLIEGARAVGESKDTLGGGFYVTTSFFEPGALDAVGEATKSGLLSRSSKKSFVRLSRKQGYHLCLVEARDGEFHLTVPEL
ncbi:hypothetical protein [Salinigranum sp.]|uniref:DUF7527 domain-containing protein n=1 Tax=Salinigranum sp. TaxID=1966351 RepID=UPI0035676E4A